MRHPGATSPAPGRCQFHTQKRRTSQGASERAQTIGEADGGARWPERDEPAPAPGSQGNPSDVTCRSRTIRKRAGVTMGAHSFRAHGGNQPMGHEPGAVETPHNRPRRRKVAPGHLVPKDSIATTKRGQHARPSERRNQEVRLFSWVRHGFASSASRLSTSRICGASDVPTGGKAGARAIRAKRRPCSIRRRSVCGGKPCGGCRE